MSTFEPSNSNLWKKVADTLAQLSEKKDESSPMVDYLFHKEFLAENLRVLNFNLSENQLKDFIFEGLDESYDQFYDLWRMDSLAVMGNKLILEDMKKQENRVSRVRGNCRHHEKKAYRGDVMVIMTLVITLLFQVAAKPAGEVLSPLQKFTKCQCKEDSNKMWSCDCFPIPVIIYEICLAAGFSISVFNLIRIILLIQRCFWLLSGIVVVILAFAWTVYAATPTDFRTLVFVIDVVTFLVIGTVMLTAGLSKTPWPKKFCIALKKGILAGWGTTHTALKKVWTAIGQGFQVFKIVCHGAFVGEEAVVGEQAVLGAQAVVGAQELVGAQAFV